jgi:hypothetical protein
LRARARNTLCGRAFILLYLLYILLVVGVVVGAVETVEKSIFSVDTHIYHLLFC